MLPSLSGCVIGIVGWKDAGKTAMVERLVKVLTGRGFTVGTVKHAHGRLSLQPDSADSMRHLEAGARTAVVVSDQLTVVATEEQVSFEKAITAYVAACDFIVVEGFKEIDIPKVAVVSDDDELLGSIEGVVAVVCDERRTERYPSFGFEEIDGLADFLFDRGILKEPAKRVTLLVNGKPVSMNEFVQSSLAGVVQGFIAALHDVEQPSSIHLTVTLGSAAGS
jgi:molybdopterin-guanine dinucleotide biosynthesis protein B